MTMETNFGVLTELGLTTNQSRMYQLLLERGPQKAGDVAKITGMKRALAYRTLDELVGLGCAEKDEHIGKILHYSATHPSALRTLAEKKVADAGRTLSGLDSQLGALSSLYNLTKGKPGVEFYEGEKGVRRVLFDTLSSTTVVCAYTDIDMIERHLHWMNVSYRASPGRTSIEKRFLVRESDLARERYASPRPHAEVRFMRTPDPFEATLHVYDNKVSYLTFAKDVLTGTIIRDPLIYRLHQSLFDEAWGRAEPASRSRT